MNTLSFAGGHIRGDNTDGAGLVRDLTHNLGRKLGGQRILLLGAGGAARGAILPLLAELPTSLTIANRSVDKAATLVAHFADAAANTPLDACGFAALAGREFDVVINATAASLADQMPPLIHAPGWPIRQNGAVRKC